MKAEFEAENGNIKIENNGTLVLLSITKDEEKDFVMKMTQTEAKELSKILKVIL